MEIENARIKTLDQKIAEFKRFIDDFHALLNIERMDYMLIESQFSNLRARNEKIEKENEAAEEKVRKALEASDTILREANEEASKIRAHNVVLYNKAQGRFKEMEKIFESTDKKRMKDHLAEFEKYTKEAVAA